MCTHEPFTNTLFTGKVACFFIEWVVLQCFSRALYCVSQDLLQNQYTPAWNAAHPENYYIERGVMHIIPSFLCFASCFILDNDRLASQHLTTASRGVEKERGGGGGGGGGERELYAHVHTKFHLHVCY